MQRYLTFCLICVVVALVSPFVMGNHAKAVTVSLSALTSPTSSYRWLDVADQAYSEDYRSDYNYTEAIVEYPQASVEVVYDAIGNTFHGTLTAINLKPNFAYQLKLVGNPDIDPGTNERTGLAGRWWQEEWDGTKWANGQNLNNKGDGSSPSPNENTYFDRRDIPDVTSPSGLHYRYVGYLVFDYFITDEDGNTNLEFETNSSFHVLWKTSQRTWTASDGPIKTHTFDVDPTISPAYDTAYGEATVDIFGEWERLPVEGIFLQPGDYVAEIILTEESFHGSGGTFAGNWAAAMGADIGFSVIQESLVIEAEDASIKTVGGPTIAGWNLWSNGMLGDDVYFPEAGTYEVVVRAYGSPLGNIWPLMELSINGAAGETVTVDSADYTDYVFQVDLTPGVHTIGVSFLNDAYNPGVEDRNLYLDRFSIIWPPGVGTPEIVGVMQNELVIEAEDASIKTVGGPTIAGWNLWSNGMLGDDVYFPEAETYEVVVRAYGSPLGNIWPLMELSIDGAAGETVTVDSADYTDYVFQVDLTPGVHTIGVSFLNDAYNPGVEDRNLYLDRVTIISPPGVDTPEISPQ